MAICLLVVAAAGLRSLQGPWIVGGDWNLEAEVLKSSGWQFNNTTGRQNYAKLIDSAAANCFVVTVHQLRRIGEIV